ncbi:MAG: hypothetical protein LBF50_09295, partial [Azoarcus sp.]|nr:hypothetical protein [Azoarcus sp.]
MMGKLAWNESNDTAAMVTLVFPGVFPLSGLVCPSYPVVNKRHSARSATPLDQLQGATTSRRKGGRRSGTPVYFPPQSNQWRCVSDRTLWGLPRRFALRNDCTDRGHRSRMYGHIIPKGSTHIFLLSDPDGMVFHVDPTDAAAIPPQAVTAVLDFLPDTDALAAKRLADPEGIA